MRELLTLVELWDRRKDKVQVYSGGMKRRLEIARGLLHHPCVLSLVIFGAGFNRVIDSLMPGVDFLKFIYPGVVSMTVLMTAAMWAFSRQE